MNNSNICHEIETYSQNGSKKACNIADIVACAVTQPGDIWNDTRHQFYNVIQDLVDLGYLTVGELS
jgi:hypothetical protein